MQRLLEELGLNRLPRPTGHAELEKLDAQRSALTSRRSHWRLGCLTCGGGSCGRASLSVHIWLAALAYVVRLAVGSVVRTVAPSLSSVSAVIGAPLVQVAVAGALVALTAVTHVASALQRHGAIESQCYAMGQTVATAAITAAAWMPASPLSLPRREAGGGGAAAAVATPDDDDRRGYARRIVRFLNAAHVAAFISLSDSLSAENLLAEMVDRFSLLTRAESDAVARLADRAPVGASGGFDLCTLWAMQQVDRARQSGALTSAQAQRLHSHAETLHALRGSLAALVTRPLPLGMRHFVLWTQALFLPLFGAAVARECEGDPLSWPFGFLGVVLVALAFALLRVLAENMSHPIGISDADLPVLRMCTTIALATQEMLEGFDEADSSSERETDQAGGATLEMAAPQFGIAGGAEARAAMRPHSPGEFEPFVFDSGDESRKAAMRSRSASPIGKGRQFKNRGRTISGDLFTPEGTCAHARAAKAAVLGSVRIDPGQSRRLSRTLSRRQVRRRSSFGATASVFPERAFLSVVAAPAAASRVATSPTESPPESPPESSPGSPPPSTAAAMEGPANAEPSFTEVEALLTSFYRLHEPSKVSQVNIITTRALASMPASVLLATVAGKYACGSFPTMDEMERDLAEPHPAVLEVFAAAQLERDADADAATVTFPSLDSSAPPFSVLTPLQVGEWLAMHGCDVFIEPFLEDHIDGHLLLDVELEDLKLDYGRYGSNADRQKLLSCVATEKAFSENAHL